MKNKIKGVLGLHGYSFSDYARYLKITPQALQSKFVKHNFKVSDFVALAEMTGTKLALIKDDGKVIMSFDASDVKKEPTPK